MATQVEIESHYDVDNDFFALFLDKKYRAYTCAVWDDADSLISAQEAKFDRLCKFANVKPGSKVLDVGCGWGGLMNYIADEYSGAHVHGLTISSEQYAYVNENKKPSVTVDLCPWEKYKTLETKFDSIISVCAFEHFATLQDQMANKQRDIYKTFFDWCLSVSTDSAQIALQNIVITRLPSNISELRDTRFLLDKVFPGSALPTISDIQAAVVDKYEISSVCRIGMDYVRTLTEWRNNLEREKSTVLANYGESVYEHHIHYLEAARRCFESGYTDLYQVSLKRASPTRVFSR